jgi:hypothetical protein
LAGNAGRALLSIRALDFAGGQTLCEGPLGVAFGETGYSSVGIGFTMSQALPFALHLAWCAKDNKGYCDEVNRYVRLAPPAAPEAPAFADPPPPKTVAKASTRSKAKSKATAKKRGR